MAAGEADNILPVHIDAMRFGKPLRKDDNPQSKRGMVVLLLVGDIRISRPVAIGREARVLFSCLVTSASEDGNIRTPDHRWKDNMLFFAPGCEDRMSHMVEMESCARSPLPSE